MKDLSPKEAHEFMHANPDARLVDVRSGMEFLFVGHPVGAIHVPWIDEPDWEINPDFALEIGKIATRSQPILLICRSGNRSHEAKQVLEASGFEKVSNILHGFEGDLDPTRKRSTVNGWRYDNLPWEQC